MLRKKAGVSSTRRRPPLRPGDYCSSPGCFPIRLRGGLTGPRRCGILETLCKRHLAQSDPAWEGILKGGVYHIHKGLGVDESVMWGEYFFVEALDEALRSEEGGV